MTSSLDIAAKAARLFCLTLGRDDTWHGCCPVCSYANHTLAMKAQGEQIALSCRACSLTASIATAMGLPHDLIVPFKAKPSNAARALQDWKKAAPAAGSIVEAYLRIRGIEISIPASLRFISRKWNWREGKAYPAMVSLVSRVPEADESALRDADTGLVASGAHYTFLTKQGPDASVSKAETEACKLTLGQLRYGGLWLTPLDRIGADLAVAEGIETALSVMQLTGLPTVAALSAPGMRAFRWPPQIRTLWIAADNDSVGLDAARALLDRALRAGLDAHIKVPANGKNDFNDMLRCA